jgi:hypothetical protein
MTIIFFKVYTARGIGDSRNLARLFLQNISLRGSNSFRLSLYSQNFKQVHLTVQARLYLVSPSKRSKTQRIIRNHLIRSRYIKILTLTFLFGVMFGNSLMIVHADTYASLFSWGSHGSGDGQFLTANGVNPSPSGVAIDSSGNVYVADSGNYRIQVFTNSGSFVTKWGSYGTADGQFIEPTGIAVDSSGNVYVADSGNYRIQKFTSTGVFITKWGSNGVADGQFNYIADVAVDSSGNVYVADSGNYRIQKFTSTGVFITKWGNNGFGNGQFNPSYSGNVKYMGLAVDLAGNVYVAEGSLEVQKFTSDGAFVVKFSNYTGYYSTTDSIAVDGSGNIFVSGHYNKITKLDNAGNIVSSWAGAYSLAVDSSGNIYACGSEAVTKYALLLLGVNITPSSVSRTSVLMATFNAQASGGSPPYLYQWYEGSNPIIGQNSSTLNIIKDSSGSYTFACKVTDNDTIVVTSNTATLTVNLATPLPSTSLTPTTKPTATLNPTSTPTPTAHPSTSPTPKPSTELTNTPTSTSTSNPANQTSTQIVTTPYPYSTTQANPTDSHLSDSPTPTTNANQLSGNGEILIISTIAIVASALMGGAFLVVRMKKRSLSYKPITPVYQAKPVSERSYMQIFLGYVAEDSKLVEQIAIELEKAGFRTWYYSRDNIAGSSYMETDAKAIKNSQVVIVVVSPDSIKSNQVTKEILYAHDLGKRFLPLIYGMTYEDLKMKK